MPDEPDLRHYEREPVRVRAGSGSRWLAIAVAIGLGVGAIGLAGTLVAPRAGVADEAVVVAPTAVAPGALHRSRPGLAADAAGLPPLVIESTDFHANAGAAYYGIGGKLLRALGPVPTVSPTP
jgi:predicted ABC-type sugar transport system permease subunit